MEKQMTTKAKIISLSILVLASYAFGRFSAPEKIKTETKIVEVEKKIDKTKTDAERDKHKKVTIIETVKPDGSKETRTEITEDTETTKKTDNTSVTDTTKTEDTTKEITRGSSKVTILAVAKINPFSASLPDYGLSVSKEILGPISVGVFGFKSGDIGAGIGLTF